MAGWKEQCCTLDHGAPRGFYSRSFAQGLYTHARGFYSQCGTDITRGWWMDATPIMGRVPTPLRGSSSRSSRHAILPGSPLVGRLGGMAYRGAQRVGRTGQMGAVGSYCPYYLGAD